MMRKLKIAQLVLPWIPLPPKGYGGTERIVYWLTEGLVKRGHEVTLFASGDSQTSAKLSSIAPKALTLQEDVHATISANLYPLCHVASCFNRASEFDIIHSHAQYLGLPFSAAVKTPTIHTFHRKFEGLPDEEFLVKQYRDLNYVSISNSQREFGLNFVATVYNGIPLKDFEFSPKKGDYLFWAGRVLEKKGPQEAIEVAKRTKLPLKIAGVITDPSLFKKLKPFIDGRKIAWYGELIPQQMTSFYQNALVTIFPVKWREPFGLIPVESMACGTPVVSYACGGASETIVDGKTGFLIEPDVNKIEPGSFVKGAKFKIKKKGVEGLVEAVKIMKQWNDRTMRRCRLACRKHVEENFTVEKMVEGYEKVYQKVLKNRY